VSSPRLRRRCRRRTVVGDPASRLGREVATTQGCGAHKKSVTNRIERQPLNLRNLVLLTTTLVTLDPFGDRASPLAMTWHGALPPEPSHGARDDAISGCCADTRTLHDVSFLTLGCGSAIGRVRLELGECRLAHKKVRLRS
jgi:hypothetical protein